MVDGQPGWDPATMLGTNQLHPSDLGELHIANAVLSAIRTTAIERLQRKAFGLAISTATVANDFRCRSLDRRLLRDPCLNLVCHVGFRPRERERADQPEAR